jgi:hypothetical protein
MNRHTHEGSVSTLKKIAQVRIISTKGLYVQYKQVEQSIVTTYYYMDKTDNHYIQVRIASQ